MKRAPDYIYTNFMIRMCHFMCLGKREEEIDSNTLFYRSLKYLTISLLTVHILTCCWFVLACNGTHDGVVSVCRDGTWATVHDLGKYITYKCLKDI